jgi:predicted nucleotidyltransferase
MDAELQPIMDKIVDHLNQGFKVQALILCGSRSVGDYKPNSDWDLKAFVKDPKKHVKENLFPQIEGIEIDCTFHRLDTKFSWEEFGRKLRFSEVIFDNKDKIASKIRKQAMKEYSKGPAKWTKQYALGRIEKVKRYENKFKDCLKDNNQAELFQRIAWHFLENTYTWWYGVRSEWEPRPQQLFADIKKRDPQFYKYLKKIYTSTKNEEKVKALHNLHKYFFSSKEFKKLIK